MEMTTIAVSKDLKRKLEEFGVKNETFSHILERLLKNAQEKLFQDLFFNDGGFVPIEDAILEAEKKWPELK